MNKKQLKELLIPIYEKAIIDGRKMDHKRFINFLTKRYLEMGVCYYVGMMYNKNICNLSYVKKHCIKDTNIWYNFPLCSHSKKEAILCLQKRIEILKKL